MTDQYQDQANVDATVFSDEDLMAAMDEEDTSGLSLQTLISKGEYVVWVGRVKPKNMEGTTLVKAMEALDCRVVYNIAEGKHMGMPIRGRETFIMNNGEPMDKVGETKAKLFSGLYVAAAYAEEGWQGERRDLSAMLKEATDNMKQKVDGFKYSDIMRNAQDFYCIGYVKLKEAKGGYDAANELSLTSLKPITPTLLQIMQRRNQG